MAHLFISQRKFETAVSIQAAEACEHIVTEMGAELHDDLIQKLSAFSFYLDRLQRSVRDPDATEDLLIHMRTDFDRVTQAVRRISGRLMLVQMENDSLQAGIEMLCHDMAGDNTGNIHLECEGTAHVIPRLSQTYLYRIVQELIHNAFKHSAAWHIWVRMRWGTDTLTMEVEDDGTGFQKTTEFVERLKKKNNTLKIRSQAINAALTFHQGAKGLLAKIEYAY